jgi:uncharacterized protein
MQNKEEFYKKLKSQLEQDRKWPALYLFKFIVPSIGNSIDLVEKVFDNTGAVIATRASKNGKYTSISIKVQMQSPDSIIQKYLECETIPGIISL